MNESTQQQVENAVRDAVESGTDIYEQVQAITLKAFTERELDLENIKSVLQAAGKGISAGITSQDESMRDAFKQSATALDDALAKAAEASKLAIEEAGSRISEVSTQDLHEATESLAKLEDVFFETLDKVARDSNQFIDIVQDFMTHLQINGTAVGKQTISALAALKDLPHMGKETLVTSTIATTSTLAQIGSGLLMGLVESLQSTRTKNKDK